MFPGRNLRISAFLGLFLTFLAIGYAPRAAQAAAPLSFTREAGITARAPIQDYYRQKWGKSADDLYIATPDLNDDNINEFIVHDVTCEPSKKPCTFKVFSETENGITPLGDITAYRLALGDAYTKGVRNLLAYESGINDYEYSVYVWEPLEARYKIEGQK